MNSQEIIQEILKGSEVGKAILEIEIEYYKGLLNPAQYTSNASGVSK